MLLPYDYGIGVTAAPVKANACFEGAAELGHASSIDNLGYFYHQGKGVAQDYAKAAELYEQAAELGNTNAMENLAILYESGLGVQKNREMALMWRERANAGQ